MPVYHLFSLYLESPSPLWSVAPVMLPDGAAPNITLSVIDDSAPLPDWANAPWSTVREMTGPNWRQSLSTAPAGGEAVMRLYTQRDDDETTIIFGRGAARIVIASRSPRAGSEGFWRELSGWILGSVLGFAMCVRGLPTLHGSVVAVDGRAIGLLGVSGAGKSTLAAAFVAAGHAMLADDHLVVSRDAHGYCALPGAARLRLWQSSMPVLDHVQDLLTFWTDEEGKRHVTPAAAGYCTAPLPLAAIYVLAPRDPARTEVAIEKLSPAAALNALMNQRFCMTPLSPTYAAETIAALSALAQQTPVRLLYRPHGLPTLPNVVDAICQDAIDHAR